MQPLRKENGMMELNREQIIKALECCTSETGCTECPHFPSLMGCSRQNMRDALSLIKELTEENERLRAENITRLPIKVGQMVYVPWRYAFQQAVATVRIEEIKFYDSQMHYMFLIDMESDNECFNQSFGGWKTDKSIGTTVFITKEEAEKTLKGE